MFSVCALFYGSYPQLAARLLNSLDENQLVTDFRFGLNNASAETKNLIKDWVNNRQRKVSVYVFEEEDGVNVGKYPMMRAMLHDRRKPAEKIMWFDDDSFIQVGTNQTVGDWWDNLAINTKNTVVGGMLHSIQQRQKQHEVIKVQPWFRGKAIPMAHRFNFATGGWWVGDTEFLLEWDYPFPAIYHNGGDSILGELVRQQGHTLTDLRNFGLCMCESCSPKHNALDLELKTGVRVNVGGRAGRRGIGAHGERYVWADGEKNPHLGHQMVTIKVKEMTK